MKILLCSLFKEKDFPFGLLLLYILLCCCYLLFAATEAEVVTENAGKNFETQMENLGKEIAEEMGIPTWGLVAILIGKKKKNG